MKPFKRTVEKVLAWIANILLLFVAIFLCILKYTGFTDKVLNSTEFYNSFRNELSNNGVRYTDAEMKTVIDLLVTVVDTYAILAIIATIVAIVASLTMKKRIMSGILFIIVALFVFIASFGAAILIYLPYFIVAIMLFVRKDPNQNNTDDSNGNQAWIANILLLFVAIFLCILKYTGFTDKVLNSTEFYNSFRNELS
ncbi:DUF4064 domain-containing protein, partial [Gemella sp. GH3]|uniref:DUF4064 domain-containing protein n=1 Tax=unclassified Gemella TaxID=2624949 RepID=UPI0015CFBABC